jgi:branched-chain amino acid transport system permease protein
MVIHHVAATINPYHWLFIIGGLLVFVVLVPRDRWLNQLGRRLSPLVGGRPRPAPAGVDAESSSRRREAQR